MVYMYLVNVAGFGLLVVKIILSLFFESSLLYGIAITDDDLTKQVNLHNNYIILQTGMCREIITST